MTIGRTAYPATIHFVTSTETTDSEQVLSTDCQAALADDLGWGLGVVFRAYVSAANDAFTDLPGGQRGYQVLSAAAKGAVTSQLALAQHLGVDRTVMTYLLDDLEQETLIERRPDPADRRARQVFATDKGVALLATLDTRLGLAEDHLLQPLGEQDRVNFRQQLRALAAHANELDPVTNPCDLSPDT
ncbi:hypothetical protein BH10ACT3_BH10ACT3_13550 [soil metagenome]